MPRLVHALPKYRLHRASGQAICTIAGRDFYLGPYRTKASKLEYDRVIAEWISSGRPVSYGTAPEEFTVVELLVRYFDYATVYYGSAKRGELANLKLALRPLRELYGITTASQFGPVEFKAIRQVLIDRGGARSYVNSQMQRVTRFFRWCAAEGLLTVTVPQTLAMIPGLKAGRTEAHETAPIRPVDPAVVEQTLAHLSPTVAAMVRVQLHTGCRPGEVVGLKVGDIDRRSEVWEARLPASETRGEGIFFQFSESLIREWVKRNHAYDREFEVGHQAWRASKNLDPNKGYPGIRYVLLHTFSHALIRQLAIECGYTSASITERIYSQNPADGDPMAGVLIYTSAADSEGTLGGLCALGEPDKLGRHIRRALERMSLCASDPLCSEHLVGRCEKLHGASCHACSFLPETSCERGNKYLDRSALAPTVERTNLAFFG